jgi:hypothetical protein
MADVRQLVGLAIAGAATYGLYRLSGGSGAGGGSKAASGLPGGLQVPRNLGSAASIEAYLRDQGLSRDQARGVAAGIWAESAMNPKAVNPRSGAYGIGQWLGPRQAELFRRYGPNPSLADQLDFLAWELGGGDHGGAAVLAQQTAAATLNAYIRRFMRPGDGTAGDLARGKRYLG